MSTSRAKNRGNILVGSGLLLVIVELRGFGLDFANDTLGYALVALGAMLAARGPLRLPTPSWWAVVVSSAGAAGVSLFGYGGPLSVFFVLSNRAWDIITMLVVVSGAVVLTTVTLALRGQVASAARHPSGRRVVRRGLTLLAVGHAVLGLTWAALVGLEAPFSGVTGTLLEVTAVMIGLLHSLTVVVAFAATRTEL